jgi:multidrug efflux pump subunit AcrA (membrane-fusion protein)
MNRHSNLALAFLLLFAVAAMWGCTAKSSTTGKDAKSEAEKNEQAVPVETAALTRGAIEVSARRSTTLEAEAEVKVLSRAANRVVELLVEEGDRVEADALLVRLEDDIQRTQLARAESRLDKARIEFERQKSLHDQRLVSDQAFK